MQKLVSLFSGRVEAKKMKGSKKGFKKILIDEWNFVGEDDRGHWQLRLYEGIELQKENRQPISGSKRQMKMIQGNVIVFHCIQT